MMKKLILAFLSVGVLASANVHAQDASAPIQIPASAALPLRTDEGSGLCSYFNNFTGQGRSLVPSQISKLLNGETVGTGSPPPKLSSKETTQFLPIGQINFRNKFAGSSGAFHSDTTKPNSNPNYQDELIPFSSPVAGFSPPKPEGVDSNIVGRMRGYIRIKNPVTQTWYVSCNDLCRITINGILIDEYDDDEASGGGVHGRRIQFSSAGLYPIEIEYLQNANDAILEVFQADGEQLDGSIVPTQLNDLFKKITINPIYKKDLFSTPIGTPICVDLCGPNKACKESLFCNSAGVCQPCNDDKHCGPACGACGALNPRCDSTPTVPVCVQCTVDAHCLAGQTCTAQKTCETKTCNQNSDCPTGSECNLATKKCVPSSSNQDGGAGVDSGKSDSGTTPQEPVSDGDIRGSGGCSVNSRDASTGGFITFLFLGLFGVGRWVRAKKKQ